MNLISQAGKRDATSLAPGLNIQNNAVMPSVFEDMGQGGSRFTDPFSRMFSERIIYLGTAIDEMVANSIIAQLLILDAQDPAKPISFYINSPGGSVYAGLGIYDPVGEVWLQTPAESALAQAELASARAENAEARAENAEAEVARLQEELTRLQARRN